MVLKHLLADDDLSLLLVEELGLRHLHKLELVCCRSRDVCRAGRRAWSLLSFETVCDRDKHGDASTVTGAPYLSPERRRDVSEALQRLSDGTLIYKRPNGYMAKMRPGSAYVEAEATQAHAEPVWEHGMLHARADDLLYIPLV